MISIELWQKMFVKYITLSQTIMNKGDTNWMFFPFNSFFMVKSKEKVGTQ